MALYKIFWYYIQRIYQVRKLNLINIFFRRFLKLKVEASGFTNNISTDEEKDEFIQTYFNQLGVVIEKENVFENSGLRHIAKLVKKQKLIKILNLGVELSLGKIFNAKYIGKNWDYNWSVRIFQIYFWL